MVITMTEKPQYPSSGGTFYRHSDGSLHSEPETKSQPAKPKKQAGKEIGQQPESTTELSDGA